MLLHTTRESLGNVFLYDCHFSLTCKKAAFTLKLIQGNELGRLGEWISKQNPQLLGGLIYFFDVRCVRILIFKSVISVARVISLVGFHAVGKYDSLKVCILEIIFFCRKSNFFHKTLKEIYNVYKWSLLRLWQITTHVNL